MKEEAVFLHLDTHSELTEVRKSEPIRDKRSPSVEMIGGPRAKHKAPKRLPQINYSLMKDTALRKKLLDLGIPNTGSRALLIRRHAEWVNIVNANADSSRPKSKREMLHELDIWDRSTGRSIANGSNDSGNPGSIMNKDFDGAAWSVNHKDDFQDLISRARHTGKASGSSGIMQDGDPGPRQIEKQAHRVTASCAALTESTFDPDTNSMTSHPDATSEEAAVI